MPVLWLKTVAALRATPVALATPGDHDSKAVTITVVSEPEELNERANRIILRAVKDEPTQVTPRPAAPRGRTALPTLRTTTRRQKEK